MKLSRFISILFIICLLFQIQSYPQKDSLSVDYRSFKRMIAIPKPSPELQKEFNINTKARLTHVKKENGIIIKGYSTSNKKFLEQVITPILKPHLAELSKLKPTELINTLALFEHELLITYYGKDFYRWGGDLLDLDDPQEESIRYKYKYGLDCSGFSTSPYELAVYLGLIKPEDDGALFSSKGYELYCKKNNLKDSGGREGTTNNFRLDTKELAGLGREVFRVTKGSAPTEEQMKLIQPGDLVGRDGHFGIIVFINNKPYYLESGGYVLPVKGGLPYPAALSIKMFANDGTVFIRRALADVKRETSLIQKTKDNAGSRISISLPDTVLTDNGICSIPLKVTDFNNIGAISIRLEYDSTVIKYKGLKNTPDNFMGVSRTGGSVNLGWFDMTGKTPLNFGSGNFLLIQFEYSGKGSTKIKFNHSQCEIANGIAQPVPVKFIDGSIKNK